MVRICQMLSIIIDFLRANIAARLRVAIYTFVTLGSNNICAHAEMIHFPSGRNSGGAIVFVHGIGGNPETTFADPTSPASWLRMIQQDTRPLEQNVTDGVSLSEYDVWTTDYPSGIAGAVITIDNIALNFATELRERVAPKYSHLIIVAHSLGGLVAKRALLDLHTSAPDTFSKIKRVVLLGTPSSGSSLADSAAYWLNVVYVRPSKIVMDLRADKTNTWMRELSNDWERLRENLKKALGDQRPVTYCGFETEETIAGSWLPSWVSANKFLVVTEASASKGCDVVNPILFADHIGLSKPKTPFVPVYDWVARRVSEARPCPSLDGRWLMETLKRDGKKIDSFELNFKQVGCAFKTVTPFTGSDKSFTHEMDGIYNRDRFYIRVLRTGPDLSRGQQKCLTTLQGRIETNTSTEFSLYLLESDGKCDIPKILHPDDGNYGVAKR